MVTSRIKATHKSETRTVLSRMDDKKQRVLFHTGGYGRGVYLGLIPKRRGKSRPGNPPHAHAPGNSGLRDVRFAVGSNLLVVGHPLYVRRRRVRPVGKTVTELMDEGGRAVVQPTNGTSVYDARYQARPFRERAADPITRFFSARMADERL